MAPSGEDIDERARRWLKRLHGARASRLDATLLTMRASAPEPAAVLPLVQLCTLLFVVDDFFDERMLDEESLERLGTSVIAAARGTGDAPPGSLQGEILRLRRGLELGWPLFRDLAGDWEAGVCDYVEGQWHEWRWRGEAWSWSDYLHGSGLMTIASWPYTCTILATAGDRSALSALPAMRDLADAAGRAIRCANDLSTHERELNEGAPNGVELLIRAGLTRAEAETRLRTEIANAVAQLDTAAVAPHTASGAPEMCLRRGVRAIVGLYAADDFNTYATAPKQAAITPY